MTYSKQSRASAGSIVRTGLRPYFGLALLFDFSSSALSARLDNSAADVRRYTAMLAGLLLIFEPNILAWGSLVMTTSPSLACSCLRYWGSTCGCGIEAPIPSVDRFGCGSDAFGKAFGVVVVPILGTLAVADAFTQTASEWPDGNERFETFWPSR